MANDFDNINVEMTYQAHTGSHAKLAGLGWKKIVSTSGQGAANLLTLLNTAMQHDLTVSGSFESDEINEIYLN